RRGSVAWQSGLNELPTALAAAFPERNILVVFPLREEGVHAPLEALATPVKDEHRRPLPEMEPSMAIGGGTFPGVLEPILAGAFPDDAELRSRITEVIEQN